MSKVDELRVTFFQESEDLLEQLADGLDALSGGAADPETVHAVFRAVHSIKGGAGAFALDAVVRFAHGFESALDAMRGGALHATGQAMDVMMRSSDHLTALLERARDGNGDDNDPAGDALLADLRALTGDTGADTGPTPEEIAFVPMTLTLDDFDDPASGDVQFRIRFRPHRALFESGNEAAFLMRDLCALGEAQVQCDLSRIPDFERVEPEGSYLAWDVTLGTESSETVLREVFEFVDSLCDLTIEETGGGLSGLALPDLPDLPIPDAPTADQPPSEHPAAEAPATEAAPSIPTPEAPDPAPNPKDRGAGARKPASQPIASTIRVDLPRIDRMINLVGELVINQAMLTQAVKRNGISQGSDIDVGLEELRTLTRQIQDSVMAIRAQPVKALFQRMSRIAREAGNDTGKMLKLVTEGASTEIDKTVIEKLADPLTHMIRNAVDHGVETVGDRIAAGKDPEGTIRLSAAHLSGRVVIEISDDGAGINRDRVRSIAEDRGLVAPDAQLTPSEIDNLIFQPGFSTAPTLTELSGRGVGMDVVKRSIQSLGGRVSISSEPGKGSVFSIVLPLTLAVLDGMVVEVGDQTVVVPISAIVETMRVPGDQVFQLGTDTAVVRLRGSYVPIVDVGAVMGYRAPVDPTGDYVILLVETADGVRAALLIDEIHDQRQVVIKGLEENYGQVPGVAAATILGDGRIALILDPSAIVGSGAGGAIGTTTLAAE